MKFIKDFNGYILNEHAGYGNDYFVDEKHEKSQYYFFKAGDGDDEQGIILKIGKFSKDDIISDSENSYGVIQMEPINHDDMDDYLVNDRGYQPREDDRFSLPDSIRSQVFEIVTKAMEDYLQKNPKVTKFYDEILDNLEMSSEDYKTFATSIISEWSKGTWSIQDGSSKNSLIYMKTSHD